MSENTIPTYGNFVRKLFNRSGDPSKDFTHIILGIVTEIHEYLSAPDEVNAREELGDLMFYLQALAQFVEDVDGKPLKVTDGEHEVSETSFAAAFISSSCNAMLDHAKRWVGYNKRPGNLTEVFMECAQLVYFANVTGPFPCTDVERIKALNVAKLLKRYPGGEYNQYHALVRDLGAERAVLESH